MEKDSKPNKTAPLSTPKLSAGQREEILQQVLAGAAAEQPSVWTRILCGLYLVRNQLKMTLRFLGRWLVVYRSLAYAAVAIVALALPVYLFFPFPDSPATRGTTTNEFTAKGDANSLSRFSVVCLGGRDEGDCRTGQMFALRVDRAGDNAYFSAITRRVDDGSISWCFPSTPEGQSYPLTAAAQNRLSDTAIRLDHWYRPGRYEVWGLFSATPLSRAELEPIWHGVLDGAAAPAGLRESHEISQVRFEVTP